MDIGVQKTISRSWRLIVDRGWLPVIECLIWRRKLFRTEQEGN